MVRMFSRAALLTIVMVFASTARADDTEAGGTAPPAEPSDAAKAPTDGAADADAMAKAKAALTTYLDAVKAKKWDAARKLIHPKALYDIAQIKKRSGEENHGLATWARAENDAYLTDYKLGEPTASAKGSVAIPSTEEEFDVANKGTESDIRAEYLVIPLAGKWYVADRRKGDGELFPAKTVGLSYKGYFDGEYVAPPPDEAAPSKTKTKSKSKTKKKANVSDAQ